MERTAVELPAPTPTVREALAAFVRLVRHGEAPPVALADGVRAVQIAEACLRSAATGERTVVESLPPR